MPRRLRIHVPGGFYHVTLRGNHQRDIFFAEEDRQLLDTITSRAIEKYAARVHAYCWMRNHLHLLMQVGVEPLARTMRQIAAEFARAMQIKLATTGHFFERRYYASLVDVESYFKELVRYIHLNPVRTGIVTEPGRFQWSSHHSYIGSRTETWVTVDFALSLFGQTRTRAIEAYLQFVHATDAAEWEPPDSNGLVDQLKLDEFAARTTHACMAMKSRQTLVELIAEACRRFEVNSMELTSSARNPYLSKVRAWIANQALRRKIASLAMVARALTRDEATLREAIRRYPSDVE